MSSHDDITLGSIAAKNAIRLQQLGVSPDKQTVEAVLMQMIAALGELATLSYRSSASLSPFEKEEVANVLGKMMIGLTTMGHCLDVDLGAAALRALGENPTGASVPARGFPANETQQQPPLQDPHSRGQSRPSAEAPEAPAGNPSVPFPTNAQTQPRDDPSAQGTDAPLMLSPTSRDSFFTYLDRLAGESKAVIEGADLRWVVPNEKGVLEELITDGARARVPYDLFPLYYGMVYDRRRRQDRAAAVAPAEIKPAPAAPITMKVPGYNESKEAMMFSPTHFTKGLFSPHADAVPSELLQANVQPPSAVLADAAATASYDPHAYGVRGGSVANTAAGAAAIPSSAASRAGSHQQRDSQPQPPMSPEDFDTLVHLLRGGKIAGPQVASLGLTFSFPLGDNVVELVPDGLQIAVTAANVSEFLRLLEDARRSPRVPAGERIHRMNSMRRLQPSLARPESDAAGFSPSHFSHDLFAPFDAKSTFYIDYDATDRTLPPFLRQKAQQQQQQLTSAGGAALAAGRRAPSAGEASSAYMNAVLNCDYGTLSRIVNEVRLSAQAATTYGVTFCVPSSLEPEATPAEKAAGVHELFRGSSRRPVLPAEQAVFLDMVHKYFPSVV